MSHTSLLPEDIQQVDASVVFGYSKTNMFMGNSIRCCVPKKEFDDRISQFDHEVLSVKNSGFIAVRNGAQEPLTVPISAGDLVFITDDRQILAVVRTVRGKIKYGICEHFN